MASLRDYQVKAIDAVREALREQMNRPVLQLPTGAGKTVVAAEIVKRARARGNTVIFTVPAIELIDQTVQRFVSAGILEIGVMQSNHELTDPTKPVQVASIQTLMRRTIPMTSIVIVDECHRQFDFMSEWMASWPTIPFIGLSATPWAKGMGKMWNKLIIAETIQGLIDRGHLSDFRVFAPAHPDLTGVRTVAGDYHEKDLSAAMQRGALVADTVSTWLSKGKGRPTLVFCVDRDHAQVMQQRFQEAGVSTGYVDAFTPRHERAVLAAQFASGEIEVVCNVGVLTTGVDWDVRCIVLARPTKSEMLYVQIIGRGLRTAPGKDHCLILDHSDTTLRLGFVTDIHHEALDDGKPKPKAEKKPKEKLPKECPSCANLVRFTARKCPACGFEMKPKTAEEVGGELAEMTRDKKQKKEKLSWEQKETFYRELVAVANQRAHKPGWAAHTYKDRFGVWPDRSFSSVPAQPSASTLSWVKHRNIARAKMMNRGGSVASPR